MSSIDLTRLGKAVESMPAFPKSVQTVLELTRRIDCEAKEVVAAIERDPVMTVKLLKVINSAYYSLPRKVASVAQAVALLGLNTVKNMALAFAAVGMLPARNEAGFSVDAYLLHSLTTAELARSLSKRMGDVDANDAYLVGLLHDFGKIMFAQFMGDEFRQALELSAKGELSLLQAEQQVMGTDHTVAGALLVERWQFPPAICQCIREHHSLLEITPLQKSLFMANQLAKHHRAGDAGNWLVEALPEGWHAAGSDWAAVSAGTPEIERALEQAQVFAQFSSAA